MLNLEIERKFLLGMEAYSKGVEWIKSTYEFKKMQDISQTYLASNENESVRIRSIVENYNNVYFTMTHKSGQGLVRIENEFEINQNTYNQLLSACGYLPLNKTRYKIFVENNHCDFDIYHNANMYGLKTIEVEFKNKEEADKYIPPSWFGREVTNDKRYLNQNLWLEIQRHKSIPFNEMSEKDQRESMEAMIEIPVFKKTFDIWVENYRTATFGQAFYLGTKQGIDLQDACDKLAEKDTNFKDYYNRERMTFWGCGLHDNSTDAARRTYNG